MSNQGILHLNVSEVALSSETTTVSTVLGSCVSVFLFSSWHGVGGVTHYALPHPPRICDAESGLRYGGIAIPTLIDELKRRYGVEARELTAKIVGGSSGTTGNQAAAQVGAENIELARQLLSSFNIKVQSESVGGISGRKALFHIPSGRVQVALLGDASDTSKEQKATTQAGSGPTPALRRPKVLIVDDSATVRQLLARILRESDEFEVLPPAPDAIAATAMVRKLRPDVITLDIHMPGITGVEWLERLLPEMPIPVVMISSLRFEEGNEVFRALELGAVDYIQKPSLGEIPVVGPLIREKVRIAASAKVARPQRKVAASAALPRADLDMRKVIAIGASTGGTEALKNVLCRLPALIPPILIVQHIPKDFSRAFANRLNDLCPFHVKEAEDGEEVIPSKVLVAPGSTQMKVRRRHDGRLFVCVSDDAPLNRHKPSVDFLFNSMATQIGSSAVGVILTGMGEDGAAGLVRMRQSGAYTIGQNEESCVVYGMPRLAFEQGGVMEVASLDAVAAAILKAVSAPPTVRQAAR